VVARTNDLFLLHGELSIKIDKVDLKEIKREIENNLLLIENGNEPGLNEMIKNGDIDGT